MSTNRHVRIHQYGAASELRVEEFEVPPPGAGEVQIRHHAIGVNYVDIYHRTGAHALPALPATLGVEGAGVIERVGPDVTNLNPGQRVAYAGLPAGSYSTLRNLSAEHAIPLPDEISFERAAGAMLRGVTAHMLFKHVRLLAAGETVLVHAAAGGLGLILAQWAKSLGARVIGTVGSHAKAELAMTHGLDHAILYKEEDFVAAVRKLTNGEGVHFAIDGIGGATLARTLDTVRPYGMVASIGQVAGAVDSIRLAEIGPARSIALSRPGVLRLMTDLASYRAGTGATLERLTDGMHVEIGRRLPLAQAAEAHRILEAGETTGSVLLLP